MNPFTSEEERRVSDAITQAERKTSGEIVVVVAARSDTYLYVPPLIGALVSLIVPWPLIFFTKLDVETIYLAQLAVFLALTALLLPPRMRALFVPRRVKRLHAHRRAVEQFIAQDLHTTTGHTGILIFVSVAERHAEILADAAIDSLPRRTHGTRRNRACHQRPWRRLFHFLSRQ